jgi:hypothetical protein
MEMPTTSGRHAPYLAGLDVGQLHDPSALAVLERDVTVVHGKLRSRYDARWLERFPLQTSYPVLARLVRERLAKLGQRCLLVIDVTGVGRGVVDLFREEWMTVDPLTHERQPRPDKPLIIAVTLLTSAMHQPTAPSWDEHHVPKRDVVMALMLTLQQGRFRAARGLKEAAMLFKEGQNFQWKVTAAGNDQYGAWREGQHDDLLLAVAVALWWGESQGPVRATTPGQQYATATGNPLAPRGGRPIPQMARGGLRR